MLAPRLAVRASILSMESAIQDTPGFCGFDCPKPSKVGGFRIALAQQLRNAIARHADVVDNPYLRGAVSLLEWIEIQSYSDAVCAGYATELGRKLSAADIAINARATTELLQVLGEVQFYRAAREHGLPLERVPETYNKRPDFRGTVDGSEVFFEVKTLSVAGGEQGIEATLLDTLNSKASIEEQQKRGRRVAFGISIAAPYGALPHTSGLVRGTVKVLRDKIANNLKKDQYTVGATVLVVNLSFFTPDRAVRNMRPTFFVPSPVSPQGPQAAPAPQSGRYWMLSFGRLGYLIQSPAEFEGAPGVEGRLEIEGILWEFPFVRGVVFLHPSWHVDPFFTGLHLSAIEEDQPYIPAAIRRLSGDFWNDELDSNGWWLDVNDPGVNA